MNMLHPIYSFIRRFHWSFEKVFEHSIVEQDPKNVELILSCIHNLVSSIFQVIPDQQCITQSNSKLPAKVYKQAFEQWLVDWLWGDHTFCSEVS